MFFAFFILFIANIYFNKVSFLSKSLLYVYDYNCYMSKS